MCKCRPDLLDKLFQVEMVTKKIYDNEYKIRQTCPTTQSGTKKGQLLKMELILPILCTHRWFHKNTSAKARSK